MFVVIDCACCLCGFVRVDWLMFVDLFVVLRVGWLLYLFSRWFVSGFLFAFALQCFSFAGCYWFAWFGLVSGF